MENVRGLLSASQDGQPIFPEILNLLQFPVGKAASPWQRYRLYSLTTGSEYAGANAGNPSRPDHFLVKAEDYGIPQARHRIIIFGVRDDIPAEPEPLSKGSRVCSHGVLAGRPRVRSGLSRKDSSQEWRDAVKAIRQEPWWTDLEQPVQDRISRCLNSLEVPCNDRGGDYLPAAAACGYRPEWYLDEMLPGTLQHQARAHCPGDLWRYLVACTVQENYGRPFRVKDFPTGLRPNHRNLQQEDSRNIFADRFCVVREAGPSRTVVSHIRKDGHYSIHYDPAQCRSLTVREAARLQTFPDGTVAFAGYAADYTYGMERQGSGLMIKPEPCLFVRLVYQCGRRRPIYAKARIGKVLHILYRQNLAILSACIYLPHTIKERQGKDFIGLCYKILALPFRL